MRSGQTECDINYDPHPDAWSCLAGSLIYNIYPRYLTVCHCVTFPVITSIEEILTTRYISDHEKVGGWWDQAGILSIMSRTQPLCYSWVFYPRNSRANYRIPRQHHFICLWNSGQTGRGSKYIVGRLKLLFTIYYICRATKISSELTEFDNLTSVINNVLPSNQAGPQQIPTLHPGCFPTHAL